MPCCNRPPQADQVRSGETFRRLEPEPTATRKTNSGNPIFTGFTGVLCCPRRPWERGARWAMAEWQRRRPSSPACRTTGGIRTGSRRSRRVPASPRQPSVPHRSPCTRHEATPAPGGFPAQAPAAVGAGPRNHPRLVDVTAPALALPVLRTLAGDDSARRRAGRRGRRDHGPGCGRALAPNSPRTCPRHRRRSRLRPAGPCCRRRWQRPSRPSGQSG